MSDLRDRLQGALGAGYRVEQELGGGGMSRVFLAEETELGRKVVIKVLPPEMAASVNVDRFRREIQLAAKLQHPHVVQLLTAGSAGDILYYIMPFIKGESLRAKLAREGELPIGEAVRILREVVDALAYAHRHAVVHRDIKPDNVLLSEGHAVVTDFGVAKAVSESTGGGGSLTSLGVALGTPAYMAPEQAVADPHVDHRADIYAAGVLAYEMVCGRLPFSAGTPQALLAAHVTEAPEPALRHRSTLPEALNALIMRCLEKKAADRWQKAEELLPLLDAVLTPSTGGITPTGTQPHPAVSASDAARAFAQAHPGRVAGLFAAASLVLLFIVYAIVQLAGLPDWVFYGAMGLLAAGLPIMLLTGRQERQRAAATMTGTRLPTPTGMHRHFTWRKALLGGGIAFATLVVVSAGYMAMRVLGIGPVGSLMGAGILGARERMFVVEFDNATPDSTLGKTVTDLLRIALAQSPVISVMEPVQVSDVLERMRRDRATALTRDLATEVAAREGIKAFVAGDLRSIGDEYVISVRLVSAGTGEALVAISEQARSGGVIQAVQRVSARLRERIGESLRTVRADPPLERFTTGSVEALQLYAQAEELTGRGDDRGAVALLQEAINRDTLFAMAYRRLGAVINARLPAMEARGDSALARAYALRDRLSERERYHVEGIYWGWAAGDPEKAIVPYLALLKKYPDDPVALNNIGAMYAGLGRFAERDEAYRRGVATGHAGTTVYTNLAFSLVTRGLLSSADTVLEQFAAKFPNHPDAAVGRATLAGNRMNWDEVTRIAEEAVRAYPLLDAWSLNTRSTVAQLKGKLGDATRLREQAIRTDAPRLNVAPAERDFLVDLDRVTRQLWFSRDRSTFGARLEELWQQNRRLTAQLAPTARRYPEFVGLFSLAGRSQRARQLTAEFRSLLDPRLLDRPAGRNGFRRAEAGIALAEGRAVDAVGLLRAVREDSPQCPFCDLVSLGDAYDRAGNADSAIDYYERYLETPGPRFGADATWLPLVLQRLGELHEARGSREKAVEYYGRFVELWKDADPELQPIVKDVRERMRRLVGEGPR